MDKLLAQLEADQRERALNAANFSLDAEGKLVLGNASTEHGVVIDRASARDPVKYRGAKARAEAAGVPLRVTDTAEDLTRRNTSQPDIMKSTVFTFGGDFTKTRFISADM